MIATDGRVRAVAGGDGPQKIPVVDLPDVLPDVCHRDLQNGLPSDPGGDLPIGLRTDGDASHLVAVDPDLPSASVRRIVRGHRRQSAGDRHVLLVVRDVRGAQSDRPARLPLHSTARF